MSLIFIIFVQRHVEDAKVHVETNCCLIMYVILLDNKVIAEHRAQSIKL
uniref:Uncharacterized protein n=1 Tax=Lepeophtheirus salmonis TaxID=72036 RepID=A0A0K2UQB5_LEPSM